MAAIKGHGGIGIVSAAFRVTLEKSDNDCIAYPASGLLTVMETGMDGSVTRATFERDTSDPHMYRAPVEVRNPTFRFPADPRPEPELETLNQHHYTSEAGHKHSVRSYRYGKARATLYTLSDGFYHLTVSAPGYHRALSETRTDALAAIQWAEHEVACAHHASQAPAPWKPTT